MLQRGAVQATRTMANELALKMIRQKRAPATKILAFQDSFHGRSTAMQELTDNPGYRQGQPVYGEVEYLTFYDHASGGIFAEYYETQFAEPAFAVIGRRCTQGEWRRGVRSGAYRRSGAG